MLSVYITITPLVNKIKIISKKKKKSLWFFVYFSFLCLHFNHVLMRKAKLLHQFVLSDHFLSNTEINSTSITIAVPTKNVQKVDEKVFNFVKRKKFINCASITNLNLIIGVITTDEGIPCKYLQHHTLKKLTKSSLL